MGATGWERGKVERVTCLGVHQPSTVSSVSRICTCSPDSPACVTLTVTAGSAIFGAQMNLQVVILCCPRRRRAAGRYGAPLAGCNINHHIVMHSAVSSHCTDRLTATCTCGTQSYDQGWTRAHDISHRMHGQALPAERAAHVPNVHLYRTPGLNMYVPNVCVPSASRTRPMP